MKKFFLVFCLLFFSVMNLFSGETGKISGYPSIYQYKETQNLVSLVRDAAVLIKNQGEAVFPEFEKEGSKWRHGDTYIFILDSEGDMILHPDSALEGKKQIELKDVNNKLIIKGFIKETANKNGEGWFHYQWPEPGSILPLWKSSFVKLVIAPSGKRYIVGSGLYNMRMEKEFIVAVVNSAVLLIEKEGRRAFSKIRDKAGPFSFLDTYVFIDSPDGVELVNGSFLNIEGRNLIDYKDSNGKYLVRDYINIALTKGAGWLDYLWPKPGQSIPSKKHTYVRKAKYGDEIFIVGSGAYLE
ncbi:MAG: cache domain-containing protein [Candidatus Omnitrophica bacterium]|nr:cache domain-containing protein [Candidatus Omnitrophota bacterium]